MTASFPEAAPHLLTPDTDTLPALAERVPVPAYDRDALKAGIVHMSVGGFHRAHQAVYLDDLLNQQPGDWMIAGVGMLPQDQEHVEALNAQDNLYTALTRSAGKDEARIVGSLKSFTHAPSDPQAVIAQLCDPAIKILSLTVTEKGYFYDETQDLDLDHPAIRHDLQNPEAPRTIYGYITAALKHRREEGFPAFTVMSCDNLPGNGDLARKMVLRYAHETAPGLSDWIADHVAFPNAMVDRITPVTSRAVMEKIATDFGIADRWPVVSEDFRQWVLEDNFTDGRPPLEKVGVRIVKDVAVYEKMKVRLLNGSHSALAYLSCLMGYRKVDRAMNDPLIEEFVRRYMDEDITPTLPVVPGIDLDAYKATLRRRFANPRIADQVQRLAEDGSQKIPNAILPCIRHQLEHGGSIKWTALALAGWFRYLTGRDEHLHPIEIVDPRKDLLTARTRIEPGNPVHLLALRDVFGDLGMARPLVREIATAWKSLNEHGAKATLENYLAQT